MTVSLRLGVAGWGTAGRMIAEAAARNPRVELVAVADPDAERRHLAKSAGVPTAYVTFEQMVAATDVDVVYVATPTPLHAAQISVAVGAGKHVIVEKPMAMSVAEAAPVISQAEAAGRIVLVGSTASFHAPVRALRDIILAGNLGPVRALTTWCHTDWLTRPRRPDDLDAGRGGGVVFRQGAHQFDVMRYLMGGEVQRVRASTFGAGGGRELGYSAMLTFADGAVATGTYSGVGGFDSRLLTFGIGELGERLPCSTSGAKRYFLPPSTGQAPAAPRFGFLLATFDAAEVTQSPEGLLVFRREGVTELPVAAVPSGWDAVLAEMLVALEGETPEHDGRWGLATLEVCEAVHASARSGRDELLQHQVPLRRSLEAKRRRA